jgi:hypothetical protein
VSERRGGVPEFKAPREPGTGGWFAAWRCRRRGGHYEGQGYVGGPRGGVTLARVCPACNRYLGPVIAMQSPIPNDPTDTLTPEVKP